MMTGMGAQGNHVCTGSVLPWAESQKHLQSNRDVRDIISVWGRKMSCACPVACRECSMPSPRCSLPSRGRLAWVEDIVLACPLPSKQLGGKTAPKTRNLAAALPLRTSHCLCLHREAEKTCFFQNALFLVMHIPSFLPAQPDSIHSDQDGKSLPHAMPLALALPFAKELFSPECHHSSLQGLLWERNACNRCVQTHLRTVTAGQARDPSSPGSCL